MRANTVREILKQTANCTFGNQSKTMCVVMIMCGVSRQTAHEVLGHHIVRITTKFQSCTHEN